MFICINLVDGTIAFRRRTDDAPFLAKSDTATNTATNITADTTADTADTAVDTTADTTINTVTDITTDTTSVNPDIDFENSWHEIKLKTKELTSRIIESKCLALCEGVYPSDFKKTVSSLETIVVVSDSCRYSTKEFIKKFCKNQGIKVIRIITSTRADIYSIEDWHKESISLFVEYDDSDRLTITVAEIGDDVCEVQATSTKLLNLYEPSESRELLKTLLKEQKINILNISNCYFSKDNPFSDDLRDYLHENNPRIRLRTLDEKSRSKGAAVLSQILHSKAKGRIMLDSTPYSIKTMYETAINKNTVFPVSKTESFTTARDFQDKMEVPLSVSYPNDEGWELIGVYEAKLKPVKRDEQDIIELTTSLSSDGEIAIDAKMQNDKEINHLCVPRIEKKTEP